MRRILLLLAVAAMLAATMVATSGAAFAVCPVCPVSANDQAQGSFNTALGTANDASNRNADLGLRTAYMNNTNP